MKDNTCSINIVLDKSGSMINVANSTIEGFNAFLKEQKNVPGDATLSLAMFNSQYELVHNNLSLSEVPELTRETYRPSGGTALLDALGRTINTTGAYLASLKEEERPSKVIFLIMTDGEENASREFIHSKIMEMITHQQEKYSWQFIYIGANQDAIQAGAQLGIAANSSYNYTSDVRGTTRLYASTSAGMSSFRRSKIGTNFTMVDPNKDISLDQTQVGVGPVTSQEKAPSDSTENKDSKHD